jgi:hypothetical protein
LDISVNGVGSGEDIDIAELQAEKEHVFLPKRPFLTPKTMP